MSYYQTEIPRLRADWVGFLSSFRVGDEKEIDGKDLPSIKVAMTRIKKQTKGKVLFTTRAGFVKRVL